MVKASKAKSLLDKLGRLDALRASDTFPRRHIGPTDEDIESMLATLGVSSLDALMDATIPESIRLRTAIDIPEPRGVPAIPALSVRDRTGTPGSAAQFSDRGCRLDRSAARQCFLAGRGHRRCRSDEHVLGHPRSERSPAEDLLRHP